PQAQDLFVEFARTSTYRMILFLLVLIGVWAMPIHYAARLLVDTDRRLQKSLSAPPSSEFECLEGSSVWVPRVLGFLTFVAVLIAIFPATSCWTSRSAPRVSPRTV